MGLLTGLLQGGAFSEKTAATVAKYGETVCLRCHEVVNKMGESPASAARSYNLGAKLNWSQVAACAAAGREIAEGRRS